MPRENHILSARSLILLTFNWLGEPASSRRVMETAKAYGFSLKSGVFYPELRGLIDEGVLVTVTVPAKALVAMRSVAGSSSSRSLDKLK